MLKFYNTQIGFREFPDEVSLLINITNCPNRCPGCHSSYLVQDIGEILDKRSLDELIEKNPGITCVGFMGGDINVLSVVALSRYVKEKYGLKTGWYSGKDFLSEYIDLRFFNYIKVGSYKEEFGPLDSKTTNQVMYEIIDCEMKDITNKFWRND